MSSISAIMLAMRKRQIAEEKEQKEFCMSEGKDIIWVSNKVRLRKMKRNGACTK
jgi:hypothetical protein